MSRVICVADASALANLLKLKGSVIGNRDILDWLWAELDVHSTDTILEEIGNKKLRRRVQHQEVSLGGPERLALEKMAGESLDGFHDQELALVALGLRLLLAPAPQVRHVVFLCDDQKALRRGRPLFHALAAFCYWTSADFVLYLALRVGSQGRSDYRQFSDTLGRAIRHMAGPHLWEPDSPATPTTRARWEGFRLRYTRRLRSVFEGSLIFKGSDRNGR